MATRLPVEGHPFDFGEGDGIVIANDGRDVRLALQFEGDTGSLRIPGNVRNSQFHLMLPCLVGYRKALFSLSAYTIVFHLITAVAIQRIAIGGDAACGIRQGEGRFQVVDYRGAAFQGRKGGVVLHIPGLLVDGLRGGAAQVVADGAHSFGRIGEAAAIRRVGLQFTACECDLEAVRGVEDDAAFGLKPAVIAVRGKRNAEISSLYAFKEFQVISLCTLFRQGKRALADNAITETKRAVVLERHILAIYRPVYLIPDRLPFIENLSLRRGDGQRGFVYSKSKLQRITCKPFIIPGYNRDFACSDIGVL